MRADLASRKPGEGNPGIADFWFGGSDEGIITAIIRIHITTITVTTTVMACYFNMVLCLHKDMDVEYNPSWGSALVNVNCSTLSKQPGGLSSKQKNDGTQIQNPKNDSHRQSSSACYHGHTPQTLNDPRHDTLKRSHKPWLMLMFATSQSATARSIKRRTKCSLPGRLFTPRRVRKTVELA